MVTKKIGSSDKAFLLKLGKKIEKIIIEDLGYRSLDAFSIEHHDLIAKPTLYQICEGKRDMKISTLRGLSKAPGKSLSDLVDIC